MQLGLTYCQCLRDMVNFRQLWPSNLIKNIKGWSNSIVFLKMEVVYMLPQLQFAIKVNSDQQNSPRTSSADVWPIVTGVDFRTYWRSQEVRLQQLWFFSFTVLYHFYAMLYKCLQPSLILIEMYHTISSHFLFFLSEDYFPLSRQ